jgi:hypothetical protein
MTKGLEKIKTYRNSNMPELAGGNYLGNEPFIATYDRICKDISEDFVIIDGSDNLLYPWQLRPLMFTPKEIIIAYYHSGMSGITTSGVIVKESDFKKVIRSYKKLFGISMYREFMITDRLGNEIETK